MLQRLIEARSQPSPPSSGRRSIGEWNKVVKPGVGIRMGRKCGGIVVEVVNSDVECAALFMQGTAAPLVKSSF